MQVTSCDLPVDCDVTYDQNLWALLIGVRLICLIEKTFCIVERLRFCPQHSILIFIQGST